MKYYPLKKFVEFIIGVNPTRMENEKIKYYDKDSFDYDFYQEYEEEEDTGADNEVDVPEDESGELTSDRILKKGDVVINIIMSKAAIVSPNNNNKVLSSNYIKVKFTSDKLNKKFFVYLFNSNQEIERQKLSRMQGINYIQKMTTSSMNNIKIPLPSLEEQKRIGCAHIKSLKLQQKLEKYKNLIDEFTKSVLENSLGG